MELKSLKTTAKSKISAATSIEQEEEYPYGTRIDLHDEKVDSLSLGEMDVGDEVMVYAKGKISSKSQHERSKGNDTKHVEIQLTDMQVVKESGTVKDRMYNNE